MHVVLRGEGVLVAHRVVHLAEHDLVVALARIEDAEAVVERERRRAPWGSARARNERALARTHEVRKIPDLLVVVDEVEDFVGLDRSTRADAELLTPLIGAIHAGGEERILRRELVIAQEVEAFAAERVGAGLGDGVDGAAGRATELRREVAHANLELLDRRLAD